MSMKELAYKIEDLQMEAEKINSLEAALFEAIYTSQNYPLETYESAFLLFGEKIFDLKNELAELKKAAFDSFRGVE